ncbi:hypothetical protein M8J77_013901 [Diaphorina citri]|nr:hypothetical protein M8J77_020920 [Diaphorina citri]KAI5743814.1 hypothetical protein M8J77_022440 [Diaphorina citri]KAI5754637.1 hypothetical protein M8J77_010209 [Diaphorina citri]KAI5755079.1 hypothetical protein M8J77_013901 [Diaphorina citri]
MFDFHKFFDCLIGWDILQQLDLAVDPTDKCLKSKKTKVNLAFKEFKSKQLHNIQIKAQHEQVIQIAVQNISNGTAHIPELKLGNNITIREGITEVRDGIALCSVVNPTETDYDLTLQTPLFLETLEKFSIKEETKDTNLNNLSCDEPKKQFDFNMIRSDHLNNDETYRLKNLLESYSDIFHIEGNDLSVTSEIKHVIRTKDEIPVYTKTYRYPEVHRKEVSEQIQKMLKQGIIRPSFSPWSSPIWIVPKKKDASGTQKWRLVIDYRKLNEKTIGDKYPIPNIADLLDRLGRCQYFSTLDLASGFHQIEVSQDSIEKTAFSTDNGHFEFLRMPFGCKNSPATFQRTMDHVLRGLKNHICLVYLDDIIIYSVTLVEHINNLKSVFDRLREARFKVQLDKSEFLKKEVSYLGHVVTTEGVKPNPEKLSAIKLYPIPKTPKEVKTFLGMMGYYRKFIKDFAKITKPLTSSLKKGARINVDNKEYKEAFELCKNLLTNEPILQYPDFNKPFVLTTDASNYAIGSVLSQGPIGSDLPIAYASRTLNDHEINYATIDKELLSIVWSVNHFRPYLYGRKFKIITDHKPLQWLFNVKEPSSRLLRWRLKLEEYDYELVYKKGTLNTNADALSRIELHTSEIQKFIEKTKETIGNPTQDDEISSIIAEPDENFDLDQFINQTYEENFPHTGANPDSEHTSGNSIVIPSITEEENLETTASEHGTELSGTIHSALENPIIGIPITDSPLNVGRKQVVIKEADITDQLVTKETIHNDKERFTFQLPRENKEKAIIKFIKEYINPKVKYHLFFESTGYEEFSRTLQKFFTNSGINLVKCNTFLTDITEENQQLDIIRNQHESLTNHRGIEETSRAIRQNYYWPNLTNTVQNYINNCEICQTTKYDRKPLKLYLNKTPTATRPFEIVHIDTFTAEKTKFLTIVDSFSKYAQAYYLDTCQAIEISSKLLEYFSHHGIVKQIISDNGGEFKNNILADMLKLHKVEVHFTCSQHPESNGIVERFHSTLIEHIRLFNNNTQFKNDPISLKVKYAVLAYNHTIHSVTKFRPIEIITGHFETTSPLTQDIEVQITSNYVNDHKERLKLIYKKLNQTIQNNKERIIERRNTHREPLPQLPHKIYVADKQRNSKTKNKYKPQNLQSINKELKTGQIQSTHPNTSDKIHLSNIKRPTHIIPVTEPSLSTCEPSTSRI